MRDLDRAKAKLEEANVGLEQANASLAAAWKKATDAQRFKSEFLANVSHELRTPLNGMIGMTDLVLATELTAEQRDHLETAKASSQNLLKQVNDLLNLAKIGEKRLELESAEFSLGGCLQVTADRFRNAAAEKGLALTVDVARDAPDRLVGDVELLGRVLARLIGNAVKFTDIGEVAVGVAVEARDDDGVTLHFCVRDSGPGISPEKQAVIFNAFQQVDGSSTREHGGLGLGLTTSARVVELMGGRIWVESDPGKGSAFHFTAVFGAAAHSDSLPAPRQVSFLPPVEEETEERCGVEAPVDLEVFDLAEALGRVGGDPGLLAEVAELFRQEQGQYVAELGEALEARDAKQLAARAHRLKGSVGIFGARRAFEAALNLEGAARKGELGRARVLVRRFQTELASLVEALEGLSARPVEAVLQ